MREKIIKNIKKILSNKSLIDYAKHVGKALGFSLALTLAIVIVTNLLYQEKPAFKRGYKVEIVKNAPIPTTNIDGVDVGGLPDLKGAPLAVPASIEDLIKVADIAKGQKIFKKCAACHSVEKGAPNKIGPNLHTVVNRTKASAPGFQYSEAMKGKGGNWNVEDINHFITKPKDFVPGTKMAFMGLAKEQDRANVIAYLISEGKK